MIILNESDIRQTLPMDATIDAMKIAFTALSSGHAEVPMRCHLPIAPQNGTILFMPAFVGGDCQALSCKAVSIFPDNANRGIPIINAAVLVFEADTGQVLALLRRQLINSYPHRCCIRGCDRFTRPPGCQDSHNLRCGCARAHATRGHLCG